MKAIRKYRPLFYPFDTITARKPLIIAETSYTNRISIANAARQYGKRHGKRLTVSTTDIGVTIQLVKP